MGTQPIHGESRTPEYRSWQQMRLRCTDPQHAAWPDYGGRGITVCDRWLNSVEAFIADMGRKPTPKHEIERIDNDKGYEPGNCRWATRTEQSRNRRSNHKVTLGEDTLTIAEWAERTGIDHSTITKRLAGGWTPERALTVPARAKAAAGQAKDPKSPCAGCGKPVWGTRCKSCENRRRAAA